MREANTGHIKKSNIDANVQRCKRIIISNCNRCRERPKKNWNEEIGRDSERLRVIEGMT